VEGSNTVIFVKKYTRRKGDKLGEIKKREKEVLFRSFLFYCACFFDC